MSSVSFTRSTGSFCQWRAFSIKPNGVQLIKMTYLITFHKSTQEFLDHGVKSDIFVQATSFLSIDLSIDKNWLFFILNWSFIQWSLIRWSLIRWSLIWWSLIQLFHGAKSPLPFISLRLFSSFLWYSVILQINVGPNLRSHKLWNSLSFLVTNIVWFS